MAKIPVSVTNVTVWQDCEDNPAIWLDTHASSGIEPLQYLHCPNFPVLHIRVFEKHDSTFEKCNENPDAGLKQACIERFYEHI